MKTKYKCIISIILFIIFSCMVSTASAVYIYVDTDASGDYQCDGTNDHIEINAAIDSASSGDTVQINDSTYIFNNSIYLVSNIIFQGESRDGAILYLQDQNNRKNWQFVKASSITNTTIQNFTINGNKAGQSGLNQNDYIHGMRIGSSTYITATNITSKNIYTDNFQVVSGSHNKVSYCLAINSSHDGFFASSDYVTFEYNTAYNLGAHGIRLYNNKNSIVDHNFLYAGDYGIDINTEGGNAYSNNTFSNNYIDNTMFANYASIAIESEGTTSILDHTFINNVLNSSQTDCINIDERDSSTIDGINIINNVIYNCDGAGMYFKAGTPTNVIAKNNIITNNQYGIRHAIVSTYNNVWNNAIADYSDGASAGTGDISANPLFYDVTDSKFYINSTNGTWNSTGWEIMGANSPCIDTGDPASDYSLEPEDNGNRINMGAYGNTIYASLSGEGESTYNINGTVTAESALNGVSVLDNASVDTDTTDAFGYFNMSGYANGTYNLTFSKSGYTTDYLEVTILGADNNTANIQLSSESTYNINGTVTAESALDGVSVLDNASVDTDTTDAFGYFNMSGYANGTYNLTFSKSGYATDYLEVTILGADNNTANIQLSSEWSYNSDYIYTNVIYRWVDAVKSIIGREPLETDTNITAANSPAFSVVVT